MTFLEAVDIYDGGTDNQTRTHFYTHNSHRPGDRQQETYKATESWWTDENKPHKLLTSAPIDRAAVCDTKERVEGVARAARTALEVARRSAFMVIDSI